MESDSFVKCFAIINSHHHSKSRRTLYFSFFNHYYEISIQKLDLNLLRGRKHDMEFCIEFGRDRKCANA